MGIIQRVYNEFGQEVAFNDECRKVIAHLRTPETLARNRVIGAILLRWLKTGFPVEMMLQHCGNLQPVLAERCLRAVGCSRSLASFEQSDWWADKTR